MQDDALRIRRAQKGDAQAFETLVAPHEKKIYALCLRLMGNREDALDGAQEAMLRAWRSMRSYRKEASFSTWLYRIATNACLDLLRKKKVRPAVSLDVLTEVGFAPIDPEGDPHAKAEEIARREALAIGIAALPVDLRTILVLRDVQGFSYEEIGEILKMPMGTVKSRINRARERLRQGLSADRELFDTPYVYTSERGKEI